jgi:hypothetical protein
MTPKPLGYIRAGSLSDGFSGKKELYAVVMEKLPGRTLQEFDLQTRPEIRKRVVAQIMCLIDYMGEHEICYGDYRPSNCLFDESTGKAYLIDFEDAPSIPRDPKRPYGITEGSCTIRMLLYGNYFYSIKTGEYNKDVNSDEVAGEYWEQYELRKEKGITVKTIHALLQKEEEEEKRKSEEEKKRKGEEEKKKKKAKKGEQDNKKGSESSKVIKKKGNKTK